MIKKLTVLISCVWALSLMMLLSSIWLLSQVKIFSNPQPFFISGTVLSTEGVLQSEGSSESHHTLPIPFETYPREQIVKKLTAEWLVEALTFIPSPELINLKMGVYQTPRNPQGVSIVKVFSTQSIFATWKKSYEERPLTEVWLPVITSMTGKGLSDYREFIDVDIVFKVFDATTLRTNRVVKKRYKLRVIYDGVVPNLSQVVGMSPLDPVNPYLVFNFAVLFFQEIIPVATSH